MNQVTYTHKYIPRTEQRESNLFLEEYYSSPDVKILMNDTEHKEISYISYSVQEQLKPLYGYASHTFDDMAVGNRIVTGSFKVPIRNPEVQTKLEDIISFTQELEEETYDYNNNQKDLMDAIDWITSGQPQINESIYINDEDVFPYVSKLISLGYDLDSNSNIRQIQNVIKQFQMDNGLEPNGILTKSVKDKINIVFDESTFHTIEVPSQVNLYYGPDKSYEIILTNSYRQTVSIIDESYDGWIYVRFPSGNEGFICNNDLNGG